MKRSRSGVPAVLPQIALQAVNADMLIAIVNGDKITAAPIALIEVHKTVTELVGHLGTPTRVEVRELDGTVHADIPPHPRPLLTSRRTASPIRRRAVPELVEFDGDGYVPGEDVAIAVILRHTSADHAGHARALLNRTELPGSPGELILLGRISEILSIHPTN